MNRYGWKIMTALLLMGGMLAGCIRDEAGMSCGKSEGVNLVISVAGMSNKQLTRAESERTDRSRIEDMNIVLAEGEGDNAVIKEIIYLENPTGTSQNVGMEDNGLITGSLPTDPTDGGSLVYHVGSTSWAGKNRIFVVCNYWQINKETGEIIPDKGDLNNVFNKQGITYTVADLKALQQGTPRKPGIMTSTLFGEAVPATSTDEHGGQNYTCKLKRTTAMITVAIETGGDTKLNTGVKITPRSICLHNVPVNCNIGIDNKVETDDRIWGEGLVQQVGWDPLVKSDEKITVGGHGNNPNIVPVFMFENLQGVMNQSNTNEVQKKPDTEEKEKYCSYIEVIADYLYTPQSTGGNQKYISGPIKYRLYLGENITNDFNVYRNKHYQVTLSLKGMGGLVEDGRTNPDGSYIGDGEGASWRVESGGVSGGGSFLSDGLNMSSNGFLSYVGFVGEPGKEYIVYDPNSNWMSWLWSTVDGGNWQSPTKDFPAKIFTAEECGGEPGVLYVRLYAQPWIDDPGGSGETWEKAGGTSLSSWIENGKRTMKLELAEKATGKIVSEFEVRQWLPMPVMVDNDGKPITTGNPNDASFYYSRIDVYEGKEIPWGSDKLNQFNSVNLNKTSFTFYNGDPNISGKKRDYNVSYGFDNVVALYGTLPEAFDFQGEYGHPENAVGVAVFRAGNARQQGQTTPSYQFTEPARIGLPTVTEWEKIMKYGVVDVRFGISNVPYWTSTMEGTQTYTYNPISGVQSLEKRDVKHRTRLVYHKNDFAKKK